MNKTVRNTLIAVVSLIALFLGSGVAYVWYSGRTPVKQPGPVSTKSTEPSALPKPSLPGPNAPEQAALQALTSPVKAGENSSINVKTNATSTCTINVSYNNVPSKDSGLTPKIADDYGNVSWSWTVASTAPAGTWPVKVTCVYHGRSAVVIGNLQVVK